MGCSFIVFVFLSFEINQIVTSSVVFESVKNDKNQFNKKGGEEFS